LDPITHTFTGAALAAAGLRRATPLATAALVMGANAPDIDALTYFSDGLTSLAFRRGWTHGVLALPLWPFVLTALLLLWDRCVRLRRYRDAAPARAGPLLAVTALAVLTHPTLDWLNNYGMRWLMPFDGTWFYGDALFIIDPWVWLALGGVLFLRHSNGRLSIARWTVFWMLSSLLVLASTAQLSDVDSLVPWPARVVWMAGLGALVALRVRRFRARATVVEGPSDRAFVAVLGIVALYVCATVAASAVARAEVRAALAAAGIAGVERVMVAPVAANPFAGDVVAATTDAYYSGRWRWLAQPRFELAGEPLPRPRGEVFDAAARASGAQKFLSWARFPVVEVERVAAGDGFLVRFSDARYRMAERLNGPTVRLDRNLSISEVSQ
jgi:inner membrane protein